QEPGDRTVVTVVECPESSLLGATIGFGDRLPARSDRTCSLLIFGHFSDPHLACRLGETSPCVNSVPLFTGSHPRSASPLRQSGGDTNSARSSWEARRSSPSCLAASRAMWN